MRKCHANHTAFELDMARSATLEAHKVVEAQRRAFDRIRSLLVDYFEGAPADGSTAHITLCGIRGIVK